MSSSVSKSIASARSTGPPTGITDVPVFNATIAGTPANTTVVTIPDSSNCNYTSGALYCFPYSEAFVSMTGWTRFFYNRNYGLLNGSGLVDLTMYFAANDQPAATWTGVANTGDIPINVNISWFTSTLAPQATNSVADPYYFYIRPNSAVYNAFPTGSSRGPTFYAVQTPVKLAMVAVATSGVSTTSTQATPTSTSSQATSLITVTASAAMPATSTATAALTMSASSQTLSAGAKAGIAIAAIALFFTLLILLLLGILYFRRQKFAQLAAEAAEKEKHDTAVRTARVPGNLYTAEEWEVAGRGLGRGGGRAAAGGGLGAVGVLASTNPAVASATMMPPTLPPVTTRQHSDSTNGTATTETTDSDIFHTTEESRSVPSDSETEHEYALGPDYRLALAQAVAVPLHHPQPHHASSSILPSISREGAAIDTAAPSTMSGPRLW